jgi:hypothetical protein
LALDEYLAHRPSPEMLGHLAQMGLHRQKQEITSSQQPGMTCNVQEPAAVEEERKRRAAVDEEIASSILLTAHGVVLRGAFYPVGT